MPLEMVYENESYARNTNMFYLSRSIVFIKLDMDLLTETMVFEEKSLLTLMQKEGWHLTWVQ